MSLHIHSLGGHFSLFSLSKPELRRQYKAVIHLSSNTTGILLILLDISNTIQRNARGMAHIFWFHTKMMSLCQADPSPQLPRYSFWPVLQAQSHINSANPQRRMQKYTPTPFPLQKVYNWIIARDTSLFQHNEVIPLIFLCPTLLSTAVSLHLKYLMNPLGFYLSMLFVTASQGQPQANWCHLIVKAD